MSEPYLGKQKPKLRKTRSMVAGVRGHYVHAVEFGMARAVCGTKQSTSGWISSDRPVTCQRCINRLKSAL